MIARTWSIARQRLKADGKADRSTAERCKQKPAANRRKQRPFLSGNDRSRWDTIRALVEHGTYAIDDIVAEPNWDTIDMVQHRGARRPAASLFEQADAAHHAAGRRVLADLPDHRRDARRASVRDRPLHADHDQRAAAADLFLAAGAEWSSATAAPIGGGSS